MSEETINVALLSAIVFLPSVGALLLAFFPKDAGDGMKRFSLFITIVTFILTIVLLALYLRDDPLRNPGMRMEFRYAWIPAFHIEYYMGVDGISIPLILLTSLISMLAMLASWNIAPNVKGYCMLFLLLETGMLGVFVSLDFFLFYVFWEVMLLPMYFLIGIWGGGRREYSAIKFFLYTLLGSVLILIAMLMFYFGSDADFNPANGLQHTFDIVMLQKIGQLPDNGQFSYTYQMTAFVLLFIGFAIKVPVFPFHTWLPDAHVDAPTPISMILAGVLLKMGGYGIVRIAYPICPEAAYVLAFPVALLGVWNIIYGAFAAMAQTDFKRLVAYSSVSHMGYVILGIAAWGAAEQNWSMAMNGAMFQMIAHGLSSAGMFFLVGVAYDRVHHRELDKFGGLAGKMPLYGGLAFGIFFAGLGLPGLCGFVGEFLVVIGTYSFSKPLAIIAAAGVILTAGYILWTIQRVFLGAEYRGPHAENLYPITAREVLCAVPLLALAIALGILPHQTLLSFMQPSVDALIHNLSAYAGNLGESAAHLTQNIGGGL
jgi:NADH-quinone oxidoreductase subunit M